MLKVDCIVKILLKSPYLLEGPVILNDYGLTKPHETENTDSAECPANEDEDTGGEPQHTD